MLFSDFDFTNYNESIIRCLCEEYESLWLIDARTLAIHVYQANDSIANMEALEQVEKVIGEYDKARHYYIDNCVVPEHRSRMISETATCSVLNNIANDELYYVDYKRVMDGVVNYNQLVYAKVSEDENGISHFMMGFRNIDGSKKAERDELTGLYTRRAFIQYAEKMLRDNPNKKFDLILSDIVDFKQINETYGVLAGDNILRNTGSYLKALVRDDMVVGRYGGDQFAMLANEDDLKAASEEAGVVIGDHSYIIAKNNLPPYVVKFGIYPNVEHDASITTICDYAHIALNSIKNDYSKTTAFYDEELRSELAKQRKIEKCMHQALEEEQFKVYYQPKHDTVTGKLVGAEALVRWVHPEYGFMSPADFIPIFERNGFISELDLYVWRRTCKNIRKWLDEGRTVVPISVNASKMDFKRTGMTETIENYVREAKLSHQYLHIEVTESLLEDNMNRLIEKLEKLRNCGYKIELDDFGAGYSSINFLSQLPIDVVKLDMSFMRDIEDDKRKSVLETCINLAKRLGYKTVSEGVETDEQLELLKLFGADIIQGYYFSKPLPEDDFEKYLVENV